MSAQPAAKKPRAGGPRLTLQLTFNNEGSMKAFKERMEALKTVFAPAQASPCLPFITLASVLATFVVPVDPSVVQFPGLRWALPCQSEVCGSCTMYMLLCQQDSACLHCCWCVTFPIQTDEYFCKNGKNWEKLHQQRLLYNSLCCVLDIVYTSLGYCTVVSEATEASMSMAVHEVQETQHYRESGEVQ